MPEARVTHLTAGRLRLKIPEKRRDEAYFNTVAQRLSQWGSVSRVEVNPLTASVLVFFSDLAALFADNTEKNDFFTLAIEEMPEEERRTVAERAAQAVAGLDAVMRRWSGGAADFRGAVFVLLMTAAAYQLLRGNIAAPAMTLLWNAGEALRLEDLAQGSQHKTGEG